MGKRKACRSITIFHLQKVNVKNIILSDNQFNGFTLSALKKAAKDYYYQNIDGKTVVNKSKGISIIFNKNGVKHVLNARNAGYVKIKAIFALRELVENAVYSNFNGPDKTDNPMNVFGYCNFKSKIIIEGKLQMFRIVVRLTKDGKFYYDHSVKVKK